MQIFAKKKKKIAFAMETENIIKKKSSEIIFKSKKI